MYSTLRKSMAIISLPLFLVACATTVSTYVRPVNDSREQMKTDMNSCGIEHAKTQANIRYENCIKTHQSMGNALALQGMVNPQPYATYSLPSPKTMCRKHKYRHSGKEWTSYRQCMSNLGWKLKKMPKKDYNQKYGEGTFIPVN